MRLEHCATMWSGVAIACALISSCDAAPSTAGAVTRTDSAGVTLVAVRVQPTELPEWTLAMPALAVVTGTESGDSAALSPTGGARWLRNGAIVIADQGTSRLLVYDSLGGFLRTLGRRGDGPAEFRYLAGLSELSGDTLAVFDASRRRLTYWHSGGGYAGATELGEGGSLDSWPDNAWVLGDTAVVVLRLGITPKEQVAPGSGVRPWRMRAQLVLRDRAGRQLALGPAFDGMYTGLYEGGDTRLPFSNTPFATVDRDRIYYGSGQDYEVAWVRGPFDRGGQIRWPAAQEALTPGEVEGLKAELRTTLGARFPPARLAEVFSQSFAAEVLPVQRPSISRIIADGDERLFVERFEPVRLGARVQVPSRRWTVLRRDGAPVARLLLPPRTRLEAVRGNHALVVQRDSLDVETVAVYAMRTRS